MIPIIEMLTTQPAARSGIKLRAFRGVTIHDTANLSPTATAKAHAELLVSRVGVDTSWHYAVDQDGAYRSIPENEVAWHAGDGTNGPGNNETVSIETCVNTGGDYSRTLENAAFLTADIFYRHGVLNITDHIFQHNFWTGKDCPHRIRVEGLWPSFIQNVQEKLNAMSAPSPGLPAQPETSLYRVQVGAYSIKENAQNMQAKLIAAGFPAIIVMV